MKTIRDMEKNFDFDKVGKKMPYTSPDGFLDKIESNVLKKLDVHKDSSVLEEKVSTEVPRGKKGKKVERGLWISIASIAAAACITMVFVFGNIFGNSEATQLMAMEEAFYSLSSEDQEFLLGVYQNDLFINE